MIKSMKFQSHAAAVETLKGFFANKANTDVVSLQDIYVATGRDLTQLELNKTWVTNKLTHLKHYQLIEPIYTRSRSNRKLLDKIQLTHEGTKALGRGENLELMPTRQAEHRPLERPNAEATLETIANDIKGFMRQNPSIQLELRITIKDESPGT